MDYVIILQALWLILPAYIANASAVLVGGGTPIDFEKNWRDGKRILGDGKTWRGLIVGAFVGITGGFGLSLAAKYITMSDFAFIGLSDFMGFPLEIPIIFGICLSMYFFFNIFIEVSCDFCSNSFYLKWVFLIFLHEVYANIGINYIVII